jgi:beta propeller repeat protein
MFPAIEDGLIAWQEFDGDSYQIMIFNISRGVKSQVTRGKHNNRHPKVSGGWAVWQSDWEEGPTVYLHDIRENSTFQLGGPGEIQFSPSVHQSRVVFLQLVNDECHLFLHDMADGSTTRITEDGADKRNPSIHGDLITWEDTRNGNLDIYLYDLESGLETQITDHDMDIYLFEYVAPLP